MYKMATKNRVTTDAMIATDKTIPQDEVVTIMIGALDHVEGIPTGVETVMTILIAALDQGVVIRSEEEAIKTDEMTTDRTNEMTIQTDEMTTDLTNGMTIQTDEVTTDLTNEMTEATGMPEKVTGILNPVYILMAAIAITSVEQTTIEQTRLLNQPINQQILAVTVPPVDRAVAQESGRMALVTSRHMITRLVIEQLTDLVEVGVAVHGVDEEDEGKR